MSKSLSSGLRIVVAGLTILTSGCASQVMQGFVGRPIESVIARYGPPETRFDAGPGRRAYQWRQMREETVAGHSETREVRRHGERRYETNETPGYVTRRECFYTLYTARDGDRWVVTDFEKPGISCE